MGKQWKQWQTLSSWASKSLWMVTAAMKLRHLLLGRKTMTNLDSILKSRDITLPTKVHLVKSYGFSSSHVWMWELDHKEGWAPKNWCSWTVVLEKTLESLDPTSPSQRKSVLNIHWKDWCWNSNTLVTWCKELTHLKRSWCWERLKAGGEVGNRGWDGWMASSILLSLSKFWEIVKDREAWQAIVRGVAKSQTQLSDWATKCLTKTTAAAAKSLQSCQTTEQQKYPTIWRPVLPAFPWGQRCLILALHPELLSGPVKN